MEKMTGGIIYIIRAGTTDRYKIGFVEDRAVLRSRLSALQVGSPDPLSFVATIANGSKRWESELHRRLCEWSLSGEWFQCNPVIQQLIKENPPDVPNNGVRGKSQNKGSAVEGRVQDGTALHFVVRVKDGVVISCRSELGMVPIEMCDINYAVALIYDMVGGRAFNIEFVNHWSAIRECDKINKVTLNA